MSHFIPSPLSNHISVSSLPTSQITFKTPLISNNYAVSNTQLSEKSKKSKRTYYYQYNILDLESYPTNVRHTQRSRYHIPNGYWVQVYNYEHYIVYSINYEYNRKVIFHVTWEEKNRKKYYVNSSKSASYAAKQFVEKITNTKGFTLSGIILFGLDSVCLELYHKNKENLVSEINSRKKLFSDLKSNSQKNKRLKNLASNIYSNSKDLFNSHNFSNISLDSLRFNIQDQFIKINFSNFNNKLKSNIYIDSILCICNESLILQDGYRQLTTNFYINSTSKYSTILKENNLNTFLNENEKVFINGDQIGNGSVRSLIRLLITLISDLTEDRMVQSSCNVDNIICLYSETKKHESLTIAHKQIIEELTVLHNNIHWKSKICTSLLPFLTIKYCVPDELHLILRIVDVLLELFFMELMRDLLTFDKILLYETMST
ncbi:hypothetical protein Glove_325g27 [Diversispora epigaea]|uniref:Uncharacterized protein n=1 Tax=Diversispora epigaea TaxID=1348612 RepID=A0A397HMP7_9GLOM|nr:hypothetical protein Glove_325g27 [Diversispora epigaea]